MVLRQASPAAAGSGSNFPLEYNDDPSVAEEPVVSGYGISIYIALAEPVLFLPALEQGETNGRTTAMLRGSLVVRVTKPVKLKAITLHFRGKARTEWPEGNINLLPSARLGIPPRKVNLFEEEIINSHTWPFFNALFPNPENGHGADYACLAPVDSTSTASTLNASSARSMLDHLVRSSISASSPGASSKEARRRSLQLPRPRSQSRVEHTVPQKGHHTFLPGDYIYVFELPLDNHLPETIKVDLGSVKYELEAVVERASAFRANVVGSREVTLIRSPPENSLEHVEPIAISRLWEDQLYYDIVISGKSFALGSQVPIAFKLTPLAKIRCHRIRVYVTENIEYYCSNRKVHRLEPAKKVQLFEKRANAPPVSTFPGSTVRVLAGGGAVSAASEAGASGSVNSAASLDRANLLGDLESGCDAGPTEMEFNVQLPGCPNSNEGEKANRIHCDTTFSNIQVHHWIKIVMRLSRPDQADPSKRRHFEISIDSPLHLLSCLASPANVALPAYSGAESSTAERRNLCSCQCAGPRRRPSKDGAAVANGWRPGSSFFSFSSTSSPTRPSDPAAHVTRGGPVIAPPALAHVRGASDDAAPRLMHLLRHPSFGPPAFDAEVPPPALMSPPPQYESIIADGTGLADYFSRLADADMDDEADEAAAHSRGRVNLPLTPGGRVARSMDERRPWLQPV